MNKSKPKLNEELEDISFGIKDSLEIYCEKMSSNLFRIFLDEPISDPSKYRSVINTLERATENDIVEFRLNTPGGNVYTALAVYNAISNCPAHTRAIVDGSVASAGTFIVLACDEVVIMKNTSMMCHGASWGTWGDMKTVRNATSFAFEEMTKLVNDIYEGFLTQEEIDRMVEHSLEYWMHDDEIIERLKQRQAYMKEKEESKEDSVVKKPRTPRKKKDV